MIDMHCHLLPGIDDGAKDLDMSLELAKQAVEEGIHTVIVTPHHNNDRFWTPSEIVIPAVEQLQMRFIEAGITLQILPGQEIHVNDAFFEALDQGTFQTLGDSNYLLLEFPSISYPHNIDEIFHELKIKGYRVIIAHPERNRALWGQTNLLQDWVDQGVSLQVTSHSVSGLFGKKPQQEALDWIEKGFVHLVASDAHHPKSRSLRMKDAFQVIEQKYGKKVVDCLIKNGESLLLNESFVELTADFFKKKRFLFW